eukprot:gb/GECG01005874.1/.p1 GENE.gb/GECG01005874.1/~~gb/GECG01005874.1/.p1  ORF type:complete len:407 (+),score=45.35 gb/GECG01005874.1/:1-1221(+)
MSQKETGLETCALCQQGIESHEPRTVFHSIQAYLHKETKAPGSNHTVPCFRLLKNVSFHGIPWDPNTCPGPEAESGKLPIHNRCQAVMRRAAKRAGVAPPGAPSKKRSRQQSKSSKTTNASKNQHQDKKVRSDHSEPVCLVDALRNANEEVSKARNQLNSVEVSVDSRNRAFQLLQELQDNCHCLMGELSQRQSSGSPFQGSQTYSSVTSQSQTNTNIPGISFGCSTSSVPGVSFAASSTYTDPLRGGDISYGTGVYDDGGSSAPVPAIAGAPVPAPLGLKDAVDGTDADDDSNTSGGDQRNHGVGSEQAGRSEQRFGCEPGDASASVAGYQNQPGSRVHRLGSIGSGISFGSYGNHGAHHAFNGSPTAFNNQTSLGDDKSFVSFGGESWMTPNGVDYQASLTKAC